MTLPFVNYGAGRRQIRYDWPPITESRRDALEQHLMRDSDYPMGSVHVDGFRIPMRTEGKYVDDSTAEYGIRQDGTEEVQDYWRKPLWSRKELLNIFAEYGVTKVRGYDLPLGHGTTETYTHSEKGPGTPYIGMDDSPDAIVTDADLFEVELPYNGEDPQAGRYAEAESDKNKLHRLLGG